MDYRGRAENGFLIFRKHFFSNYWKRNGNRLTILENGNFCLHSVVNARRPTLKIFIFNLPFRKWIFSIENSKIKKKKHSSAFLAPIVKLFKSSFLFISFLYKTFIDSVCAGLLSGQSPVPVEICWQATCVFLLFAHSSCSQSTPRTQEEARQKEGCHRQPYLVGFRKNVMIG